VQTVSQLLEAMDVAARANRKEEFDRLELELLSRFEEGFDGMPADVYERYLEVDRAWPVVPPSPDSSADRAADGAGSAPVGPPTQVTAELPEELVSWIAELGDSSGCNRSEVLTECLQTLRGSPRMEDELVRRLAARRPR
jgi:hypothetical protein